MTKSQSHASWWEWALLILILLVAVFFRLYRLESVPPGLTHDEAGHGHDAVAILRGARPMYETVGYGREPLYDYVLAGLMALGGATDHVLRFSPVPLGLITLMATFAWARLAFDVPTALAAVALQAASFWSLATGRQALRSGLLPSLFTIAVYLYWRLVYKEGGLSKKNLVSWLEIGLFALAIGATLYTYIPARVLWVVFPAFLVYLAGFHRETFRRVRFPTLIAVLSGLLLGVPLFAYLRAHPGAEQRLEMLDVPLQALLSGDVSVVLGRAWGCIAGFFVPGRGDDFLAYTIPGRPFFDPLTGALFLVGVGLCLARWRDPARAFSLIWFLVGISPSLITGAAASTTRSIAALPVAFLFPALAIVEGARWADGALGARGCLGRQARVCRVGARLPAWSLPVITLSCGESRRTCGRPINTRSSRPRVIWMLDRRVGSWRFRPSIRTLLTILTFSRRVWRGAIFRCAGSTLAGRSCFRQSRLSGLIVPSSASLDAYFAGLPGLRVRERVEMRPDDLDPFFIVYDWEPQVTLAGLRERAQGERADFGGALQFLGYDLRTPTVAPGEMVELVTLWQVTDSQLLCPRNLSDANEDLVLFTHALDAAGNIVGQEDRLDAPAWDWQVGDAIAQIHRFTLPPDLPAGPIALEVGAYRRADLVRLPVLVDGVIVGDRVLLQPVEIIE